jgi:SAM-dependent methyltransferase
MKCRNCLHELSQVFVDLGATPPSNSFLTAEDLNAAEVYYPLKVLVCDKCFLAQVDEHKKTESIFDKDYVYFSSYSKSWLQHAEDYSAKIISRLDLNEKSFVVEVASNDGYLLKNFKERNIPCLGVEPTASTAKVARALGIQTEERFFGESYAKEMVTKHRHADLIAGNNVLAHVPDLHDFVEGFRQSLSPNGVVTLEFPHLYQLVSNNQFDTIYHEHFSYLSLSVVQMLFKDHGMRVFDVDQIETHGGSLRIYACLEKASFKEEKSVSEVLSMEESAGMMNLDYYKNFQEKTEEIKFNFLNFLLDSKKRKLKVAGYGAAAKGNTLMNFAGIKSDLLPFVVDASPHKQNKYLPGSRIPVKNLKALIDYAPDFVIIFPWNIKQEIVEQFYWASWIYRPTSSTSHFK